MSKQTTANEESSQAVLTPHTMLVAWGLYAQGIGLGERISQVELSQKTRTHRPQTKILEFLVAILAGVPHLQDISRSAHPLDQDQVVAEAWGQPGWADYTTPPTIWPTGVESPNLDLTSVKHMVQVCVHTSAWVLCQVNVWLLTFVEQRRYAGSTLRFGIGSIQLPLPLAFDVDFSHF